MRKFLYTIVVLIVLVAAVLFALRLYSDRLTAIALVPDTDFVEQDALADNAYANPEMWFSRPGMGAQNDPARWQPTYADGDVEPMREGTPAEGANASPSPTPASAPSARPSPSASPTIESIPTVAARPPETRRTGTPAPSSVSGRIPEVATANAPGDRPRFAVFFVHPTSLVDNRRWNAPLDDAESQRLARIMVRGMASAFNQASEIWVPRYRQATFGAFLSDSDQAELAIDAAYRDVAAAFDYFVASIDPDMPIVIAGHSQGSLHLLRLMREKIAGTPLEARLAMAYPLGWPISVDHDLPSLPLPACASPQQAGCIVGYASFAEPADPGMMLQHYSNSDGFDGQPRADSPILCVNPLTGTLNGMADASRNAGTLVPDGDLSGGELLRGAVGARCDEAGLLLIGDPPDMGSYVLPFNNYHVYDIPLFWQNLQLDVARRLDAWNSARS